VEDGSPTGKAVRRGSALLLSETEKHPSGAPCSDDGADSQVKEGKQLTLPRFKEEGCQQGPEGGCEDRQPEGTGDTGLGNLRVLPAIPGSPGKIEKGENNQRDQQNFLYTRHMAPFPPRTFAERA
jgi:hypothetical protein